MAMLTLEMNIYTATTGVQMTIDWANEDEYQLGKAFLASLGVRCFDSPDARASKPEFVYLENEQQLKSLFEYLRSLKEKTKV